MTFTDRTLEQLEADTRALSLDYGRRVGQPGHAEARAFLTRRMEEVGLRPFLGDGFALPYDPQGCGWGKHDLANLVGVVPGRDASLRPILIGAHYDSVIDEPCSDDNATAVAVALGVATALRDHPLERDVLIAFFDAEEPPYFLSPAMGSIRFYEDQRAGLDFAAVIIMDLIGHDVEFPMSGTGLEDLLFILGAESHGALPEIVERSAAEVPQLRVLASLNDYVGDLSDHHAFRLGGQPYLFLSCGQGRCYHSPCDTPEWVNFEKVGRVYELVLALVHAVDRDGVDPEAPNPPTTEFEIRMIERTLGPVLEMALRQASLDHLRTRSDLDRIVEVLMQMLMV